MWFSFFFPQVHSNNRHTQGVRVFSKVECLFKRGLLQPWSSPLTLPVPLEDLKDPSSRPISLPLGAYAAQILRCKFYFADPWLLISEISFLSGKQRERDLCFIGGRPEITSRLLLSLPFVPHAGGHSASGSDPRGCGGGNNVFV